ncbi:MAG TPA: hypothetical protein ENK02_10320 [Planctomycetes bacterium]|nr:hypothetical protein [Planctomycetota bacterium]
MNDIPASPSYGKIRVGDYVLIDHQFGGYVVFSIAGCDGVDIQDTTVHHWAGMGIGIHYSSNINISGFQVIPDPNTPKPELTPMSTTADAIHIRESWGAMNISDCTLDGMGDDAINVYVPISVVAKGHANSIPPCLDYANRELEIDKPCNGVCLFKAGDLFEFLDKEGRPLGAPNPVQSFTTPVCGGDIRIKFTNPLPNITGRPIHYVYDASQFPSDIQISHVTVFGNRAGGFMLHRNTTVSNCTVDSSTSAAILVGPSIGFWNEGPAGGDVLIQNSQFLGTTNGEGFGMPEEGAISIATAWYKDLGNGNFIWTYGPQGGVGHVTIDGCTFDLNGGANICARSADWVTIQNCDFWSTSMHYGLQPTGESQDAAKSLIWFSSTGKADILMNTVMQGASWVNPDGWLLNSKPNPYNKSGNNF